MFQIMDSVGIFVFKGDLAHFTFRITWNHLVCSKGTMSFRVSTGGYGLMSRWATEFIDAVVKNVIRK